MGKIGVSSGRGGSRGSERGKAGKTSRVYREKAGHAEKTRKVVKVRKNEPIQEEAANGVEAEEKGIRLQVYLANCGLGSRRKCEEFIEQGLVKINNITIFRMGEKVFPEDIVQYRNREVYPTKKKIYLAFNKTARVISSNNDPQGRTSIISFFKEFSSYRLFTVGRLDYMSWGLILLTNDGNFGKIVSHPSSEIEKEYIAETKEPISEENLKELLKGVRINGELYKIKKYVLKSSTRVSLVLVEGKNREIRNIFSHYRIKLKKLQRVRIGCVKLSGLQPGTYRNLTEKEVKWFLGASSPSAPASSRHPCLVNESKDGKK
ncbi:MAG: rRNA pseudouridine synthase [Spirochaetes bacterium]|nr:rRNA pseudouridine synthase [Spirochaetota bacterium]